MADETIIMGDADETVLGDEGSTRGDDTPHRGALLSLRPVPLDFVANNGESFTLMCGDVVGEGGEGCVVRAVDDAGREYVAKVAYSIPAEQANTERILQLLYERTQADPFAFHRDHLMPIYAWGTLVAQPLGSARETELLVTIMPRCTPLEGSALTPPYVKKVVLPQLARAIQTLHELNIVHRDVKPANVYLYADNIIVLGDFGISTMLEGGESVRNTRLSRRTPGYTPHVHFVVQENDWYALGYTLWTLYNGGVHPHQQFLEEEMRTHESATLAKVMIGERPVSFRPRAAGDETFGQLIYGLTTVDVKRRLGFDDIQRYLADPAGFSYSDAALVGVGTKDAGYDFEGVICHDKLELARALGQNWERARRHLYSNNVSKHLSAMGDHNLSTTLYEIVEEDDDTISNQDLGLAKAIWLLSGDQRLLCWKGADVSFPTLVEAFGGQPVDELARYDDALASGVLSWSLARLGEGNEDGLTLMQAVEAAARTQPRFARCLFRQLFVMPESAPADRPGFEAQMRELFANPRTVYELVGDEAAIDDELASLAPAVASLGTLSRLVSGRAELAKKQDATVPTRVEMLLVLLDAVGKAGDAPEKGADKSDEVRAFAYTYGPKSAWLWAAAHVHLYKPSDQKATQELRNLVNAKASEKSPVIDIMKAGDRARHYGQIVAKDMPRTPLNVYLGYEHRTPLECHDLDGFFCSSFYGEAVPRGFVRELLLKTPEAERASWTEVQLLSDACRDDVSKQGQMVSALTMSLDECEGAVLAVGTKQQSLIEILASLALLVLMCIFFTRKDFVGMATGGFARTLALGHPALPEIAGLLVQVVAWSTFIFAGINFFISLFGYMWSAGAEKLVNECQAIRDRAQGEKDGFVSGQSGLAQQIMDPQKSGAISCKNMYRRAADLASSAEVRSSLNARSWYTLAWSVSLFLTALGLTLYFGTTLVGLFYVAVNQALVQIGIIFKMQEPPVVNLGSYVYLIILAVAFFNGYGGALSGSGVQTQKHNALLWLKQLALTIFGVILSLVLAAIIVIVLALLFNLVGTLAVAFVKFAPQHPMAAMAIAIVVALIVRLIIRLLGRR